MEKVRVLRIIFDEEETTTAAKAKWVPEFETPSGRADAPIAACTKGYYEGSVTQRNKVAYVTFSDFVTKRFDVREHPQWRTVEINDYVEKKGDEYIPLYQR